MGWKQNEDALLDQTEPVRVIAFWNTPLPTIVHLDGEPNVERVDASRLSLPPPDYIYGEVK